MPYRNTPAVRIPPTTKLITCFTFAITLEMTERFLVYVAKELPGFPDSMALDETDEWPAAFKRDQDYLRGAIASLKRESDQVHDTVCDSLERKNSRLQECRN